MLEFQDKGRHSLWRTGLCSVFYRQGCPSHTDEFPTAFQRILTFHNTLNAMFLK